MVSSPLIEIAYKVRQATGSADVAEQFAIEVGRYSGPRRLALIAEKPVEGMAGLFWSAFIWAETPQGHEWWQAIAMEHGL